MKTNRQLAAILFADIAGYTALMQQNEVLALQKLNHFRRDIEFFVPKYSGHVVQFYGDGCLLIFNSVINAINCSIELQKSLKLDPPVPVRIGAHQGDIIMEGGNIFGNSVNIAARIESMSIPGAVLLSEKVRSELSNQPEINLVSLGSYEFKNVENPIEVFALEEEGFPIPQIGEIKGKFKEINTEKSIAVLAFENRSSDPEQEYFGDGIAEEIIYGLSQLDNLKVAARSSSFAFKNSKLNLQEVAKQLNVETILEGSIRKMGNKVRVNVQMVKASDGFQIWTERYDRELEDIFAIQDEIADKVVRKMKLSLLGKEKGKAVIPRKTDNVEAYQLFLQGRNYLDQRINVDAALACFNNAIELDTTFASAYTSVAYAYFYKIVFANYPPKVGYPKAEMAVGKALSLDSTIAEAHTMQGLIEFYFNCNIEKAREEYNKALMLQPQLADTYRVKAYFHSMILESESAVKLAEKALELEPLSFNNSFSLADIYYRVRRYDDAINIFLPLVEKYPDSLMAREMLGTCYFLQGNMDKAKSIFEQVIPMQQEVSIYSTGRYVFALKNGNKELALKYLDHLHRVRYSKWVPASIFSILYFYLDETEKAIQMFRESMEDKDSGGIFICNVDPLWAPFRDHPEIQKALKECDLI